MAQFADRTSDLFQHSQRCPLLLVWWVSVLAQDALYEHAQMRSDVLSHRPVDSGISANCKDQLLGQCLQGGIAQHLDGTIIDLKGIVASNLVLAEAQLLSPGCVFAHLFRKPNQFLNDLRRLDSPVLVLSYRLGQQFREQACFDYIPPKTVS